MVGGSDCPQPIHDLYQRPGRNGKGPHGQVHIACTYAKKPVGQVQGPPPNATTEAQEAQNTADFITQSLNAVAERVEKRRDPTAGPGPPDPTKGYRKSERSAMLEEHGGVDVTDPKLCREWTMRMLVKHGCPSILKSSQKVDPTVLALAAANVSPWTSPTYPFQKHMQ